MTSKVELNRRGFFKYMLVGGVGSYSLTYSPPSNAFAFTAAAIATGEKMGWAMKPIIDKSVELIIQKFNDSTNLTVSSTVNGLGLAGDGVLRALDEIANNRIKLKTTQSPMLCEFTDNATEYSKTEKLNYNLSQEYKKFSVNSYTSSIPLNFDQEVMSFIPSAANKLYLTETDEQSIKRINELYFQLGYNPTSLRVNNYESIGWLTSFNKKLKNSLINSALNRHLVTKVSQRLEPIERSIISTYHNQEWRNALNDFPASEPLSKELIIQFSISNAIAYHTLISKQNILLIECLHTLEEIGK